VIDRQTDRTSEARQNRRMIINIVEPYIGSCRNLRKFLERMDTHGLQYAVDTLGRDYPYEISEENISIIRQIMKNHLN
jgi:hypothetical protein